MRSGATQEAVGRVWDPVVRLTHWGIALAIVLNGLLVEGDVLVHLWIGYAALGLLALRLVWGLIGPARARFSAFPPSLSGGMAHLRGLFRGEAPTYPSHNPAGALMVYAIWGLLLFVTVTGIVMENEPFPEDNDEYVWFFRGDHGEEHDEDDDDDGMSEIVEDLHEGAANALLFLSILHVGGVFIEARLSGEPLIRRMIGPKGPGR